jgi:YHS domain-containing protein
MIKNILILTVILFSSIVFAGNVLEPVENEKVCMVNDTFFGTTQIPVKVGSKTYYGCCENCKKTLKEDANSRFAVDPVSKKKVDKATAVIGATKDNRVYYFQSPANMKKFGQMEKK